MKWPQPAWSAHLKQLLANTGRSKIMAVNEQDRDRRRALFWFQIAIYGFLLGNFAIQLYMSFTRDW